MPDCQCHAQNCCDTRPRRRFGVFRTLFSIAALYAGLLFGSGTLINTGHPVASEVGKLIHVVTFVEPAIDWADRHDYTPVAHGLRVLANGVHL